MRYANTLNRQTNGPCIRCNYVLSEHVGDDLRCPVPTREECPCLSGEPDKCTIHGKLTPTPFVRGYTIAEETPREHIANALTVLYSMRAGWIGEEARDDLSAVINRLERAVLQLDGGTPV